MSEPKLERWSVQEFFAWQERHNERNRMVGGEPVQRLSGRTCSFRP
ncbi:hypothetical protein ABZT49_10760 [Methylobacterium sp. EM32]